MAMKISTDQPRDSTPPPPDSSPLVPNPKISSHILHTPIDSPHSMSPHAGPSGSHLRLTTVRRQSGFDPMRKDDEVEYEQYGDLGDKHPLRRIEEKAQQAGAEVSLPGVKALFGAMQDHPPTPSSSQALFYSSSLPSLLPGSPTSASTSRTSRYPSIASASSHNTGSFSGASNSSGWWAPDYDRSGSSSAGPSSARGSWAATSPRYRPAHLEPTRAYLDEHYDKRRRSDQPSAGRDPEEAARLHWAAQNRNASYPTSQSVSSSVPMRSMLHPPPVSMSISRSIDTAPGPQFSSPLTPHDEVGEFPFDRRPNAARQGSIVGGTLAQSFADLSASERSPRGGMAPPDLRSTPTSVHSPTSESLRPPSIASPLSGPSTPHRPTASPQPPMSAPPARIHVSESSDRLRRQSLARPLTPETDRRSSLTELIRSKTGDDLAIAQGRYARPSLHSEPSLPAMLHGGPAAGIPLDRPSLSDTSIILTGWHPGRPDRDSPIPSPMRNRKRSVAERPDVGMSLPSPGVYHRTSIGAQGQVYGMEAPERDGMRGMDILAESARRMSEAERDSPPGTSGSSTGTGTGTGTPVAPRPAVPAPPPSGPKYQCDFCPKNFSRPSSLKIHRFSHTGERPFKCSEPSCGRSFSVQSNLKRHAKVHLLQSSSGGRVHPYPHRSGSYSTDVYRARSDSDETLSPLARRHSHASGMEEEIDELDEDEDELDDDEEELGEGTERSEP